MTPEDAAGMYRRIVTSDGQTGFLRNPGSPNVDSGTVHFRIVGFRPSDIVGSVQQGDRKVILLAEDVGDFALTKDLTRLMWNGSALVVKAIDDSTRNVGGTLIAYELRVTGA